jgi:uncharacterized membrane protein YdjX (TVP38/TMEM64 family)
MNEPSNGIASRRLTATVKRFASAIQWVSVGLILLSLVLILRRLPVWPVVKALGEWIEELGFWGSLVFGLIYAAAVVALIPGSVLTLAAGALFGLTGGTIIASLASTTGSSVAFLISRSWARERIAAKLKRYPKFEAIDQAVSESGWKIVALLRLSPAVPFNLQNYLYGLTGIRFWPYVLTSWLAMMPATFMYVYLGDLGRESLQAAGGTEHPPSPSEWGMLIVGLIATVGVAVYLTRLARKALREQIGIAGAIEPTPNSQAGRDRPKGWPWGAIIAAILAVAALVVAGYAQFNADAFKWVFSSLQSP